MSGWTWRYHAADGTDLTPAAAEAAGVGADAYGTPDGLAGGPASEVGFPSQADAETWVGESWRELLEAGVESVTLLRDGEPVYGPMSLRPME